MKLSTRLTIFLSLLIVLVLTGYGYFHVQSRRDVLFRKMQTEVHSAGRTLKVALEKIPLFQETEYVQGLIDAVEAYEKTLGVIVYHQQGNVIFRSVSVKQETEPYLNTIKRSMGEDSLLEGFNTYKDTSIFFYCFPLKDAAGKNMGGVSILQHTSFMEKEIREDKWRIFLIILLLIGGTVGVVFLIARRSIHRPISVLLNGIKSMAEGNLGVQVALNRNDELGELAHAFNNMTISLKQSRERLVHEAKTRLELERNFRHSEKLATIGQFASELAHEIGTPLNIIAGRAALTKENPEAREAVQKNMDTILTYTGRITKTVQQLLSFARRKRPERKRFDVNQLLEATLDLLDYLVHGQGIIVKRRLETNLPLLEADLDLLQQVFVNLILNSFQSMPEGGTLQISTSQRRIVREGLDFSEQEYVEISLEDTGVGMDEDMMRNLFTPFFTTKEKGTGLGLTITNRIVQEHGGWIDVKSNVGKGSVFTVYLPVLREGGNLGRK